MRIVKAWQTGRRRKVKALQRLLVRSRSGKALAVRRVTENQGKRTPGVGTGRPGPLSKRAKAVAIFTHGPNEPHWPPRPSSS